MTLEQQTAHSYLTRDKATFAADAGAEYARNLIYRTISDDRTKVLDRGKPLEERTYNNKVNFITWAYSPNADTFAPFYTGILSNAVPHKPNPGGDQGVDNVSRTVWLFSDPVTQGSNNSDPANVAQANVSNKNICNINFKLPSTTSATGSRYWIDQSGTPYNVGWVQLPITPAPPATSPDGQLKVRYAFWVDDEMGRADLGALGHAAQDTRKYNDNKSSPEDLVIRTGKDTTALSGEDMNSILTTTSDGSGKLLQQLSPLSIRQMLTKAGRDLLDRNPITYTVRNTSNFKQPKDDVMSVYDLIPYGPQLGQPKINLNDALTKANTAAPDQPAKFVCELADSVTNPDPSYSDYTSQTNVPSIKTALPEYYNRKNSPPGNMLRIAASIRDYISSDAYPSISPGLNNYLTNFISQAYNFWKADYSGPPPSFLSFDWSTLDLRQRWYGIKGGPFINAIQMANTYTATNYGLDTTFYLWNPNDRPITLTNAYVLFLNYPIRLLQGAMHNGTPVDGLPYFRGDVFPLTSITLAPRALTASRVTRSYSVTGAANNNTAPTSTRLGFILFTRDPSGTIRVLDGFRASSVSKSYSASGGLPGGGRTGASNEWDTKDRRQSLALVQNQWSTAASATSGNLAQFQDLTRWYDRSAGTSGTSPVDPLLHIASRPMKSLGELGNVFDPVNDLDISINMSADLPFANSTPISGGGPGGLAQSRGGKTLNVGQFDDFFDKLQTAAPVNPMQGTSAGWSSYEKYLRFGDAALFDLFTMRLPHAKAAAARAGGDTTAQDTLDSRPYNINTSRPNSASGMASDDISPLSTYISGMNSALGAEALGPGTDATIAKNGINGRTIAPTTRFMTAVRSRLAGADWTQSRPFRNYNDLALLGLKSSSLSNVRTNKTQSLFYATSPNFYLSTSPTPLNITIGTNTNWGSVFNSSNHQRQAPFAQLAGQTTFRSYRYRIYAVGQVYREGQENKPLATVTRTYIYDLNPIYDSTIPAPSDPTEPADNVVLYPNLQRIEEN